MQCEPIRTTERYFQPIAQVGDAPAMTTAERRRAGRLKRAEAAQRMNPNRVPVDELIEFWPQPLTVEELAAFTGISEETLYRQVRARKLPSIRIGSSIRLEQRATAEWFRSRRR